MLDDSEIQRILVIAAHPDDVDVSAAGPVALWTDAGIEVIYCIVTDGDAGGHDESVPRAEVPALRRAEQTAAAKQVGVHDVRFLGYPDGRVEASLVLRRDLARVIREVRPQRVVAQSPELNLDRIYASHPDHRAGAIATLDAVYPDARNRWAHTELLAEGLEPHTVDEVWLSAGLTRPTHFVDVTDTADRKVEALLAHKSQMPDPAAIEAIVRAWMAASASAAGLPDGRLAEVVRIVNTR